ncbi:hypothetical protein N9N67_02020 [Bacteriovoracaceae bacterium]|nr:hypothetical protein [Bacteriovoracaceae bacterium]
MTQFIVATLFLIFVSLWGISSCGPGMTVNPEDENTSSSSSSSAVEESSDSVDEDVSIQNNACERSPGCTHWFDASDASSLYTDNTCTTSVSSDGDDVKCFENQGSASTDELTRAAGFIGSYEVAEVNSLSTVGFATNAYLPFTSYVPSSTELQFMVAKLTASPSGSPGRYLYGNSGTTSTDDQSGVGIDNNGYINVFHGGGIVTDSTNNFNNVILITKIVSSGTVSMRVNGIDTGTPASVGTINTSNVYYLGSNNYNSGSAGGAENWDVGEIVFYNTILDDDEIEAIETHLINKWGI